ncbi:MAG: CHAT domain-containing protein [Pirellulaceae bacterium]
MLSSVAMQHMQAGRIDQATTRINEAIALGRKIGTANAIQTPLMIAMQIMGKLDADSREKFMMQLLQEEAGNAEVEAAILKTLGDSLFQSGDLVRSIELMHDYHAKIAKSHPGSLAEIHALQTYGHACMLGNLFDLGIPALKQARKMALGSGNLEIANLCTGRLGDACMKTGDYETAKTIFRGQLDEALKSDQPTTAMMPRNSLVMAYLQLEEFERAQTLIDQELPKLTGYEKGYLQGISALISAERKDYAEAIAKIKQAMNSKLETLPFLLRFQYGGQMTMTDDLTLGHYQILTGKLDAAVKSVGRSEKVYQARMSQMREAAKTGAMSETASETGLSFIPAAVSSVRMQALAASNDIEAALLESERGRGQMQARAMRKTFDLSNQPAPETLSIDAIRDIARETDVTLVHYALVHPVDFVSRSLLPESSDLKRPSQLFVWVVTPDGKITLEKIKLTENLATLVDNFRAAILPPALPQDPQDPTRIGQDKEQQQQSFTKTSRTLYDLLIGPIEKQLPADPEAVVVVVPQSELFAIPFAALMDEQGNHLIENHTLVTSPSIEMFRLAATRGKPAGKLTKEQLLVVGNPEMPAYLVRPGEAPVQLNDLPGSEVEAKAIANLFGIEPLIGKAATEVAVCQQMKSARVIHLATHGLLESENVFTQSYLSSIALAPSDEEDGFLSVREVTRMKLDADLVVLSACDTGRGTITGEGITGLSQAYMMAGVPTTVVSLWPVSDKATAVMMVNFYKALSEGKATATALRLATLANRDQFESPRLWAPFTVYGLGR